MAGFWRTKYFGLRYGAAFGALFPPAGDTTAPTITTGGSFSINENTALAISLTADEAVTWSISGGPDAAKYEISGTTLRFAGNATKNFEAPDDADTNNTYIVTVRATDAATNFTDKGITVTILDVDESGADPTIGVPVLSLAVPAGTYPPQLNTPLPPDWQADVTSVRLQAATVANADAGWGTTSIDNLHLITNAEAIAGAWAVTGLSGITTPAVTVFRARAEQGGNFSAWSNELIHGDTTAPTLTSSTSPTAIPELTDSLVYTATFSEKVTITGFGGTDAALLEADNPTVPATTFAIRRLDHAIIDYEAKASYSFTISFKDRANNAVTSATITAAISDIDEIPSGLSNVFTDKINASDATLYTAPETYTVAGLATSLSVPISITNGEYRKNGGSWTAATGTVTNGDTVEVRGTSGVGSGVTVNVVLTIGGGSDTFSIINTNTFDPASLFGGSDEGYFFDISDLSTVFSDTARTTLASVDGPVKGVTDKSGKGHHMAWVSGNTLTLRQSGSFYYLEASATNGVTLCNCAMAQPWYRISAIRINNWAQYQRVFGSATVSHGVLRQNGSTPQLYLNDSADGPMVSPTLSTDYTISEVHNDAGSSIQLNSATAQTGTSGTQTADGQVLFDTFDGIRPCAGFFYGDFAISRDPTSGEKASLKTFFAAKYGGSL